MAVKFTNNAATTLAAGINSSVTSISVTDGSVFPALTGSDHFYVTFDDTTNREIVKVTARSGNTLTVVRGQDDTTAQAFNSGDKAELRVVAALLEDITTEVTSTLSVDTFTGDGTTTAFTLSQAPSSEDNLIVFIEGAYQNPGDFVLSGTTLTLDEAPVVDRNIIVYHVKGAVSGNNLNQDSFTADGNTAAFTLSIAPIHENNTQVFIDGVYQQKNSYSISGTTLTLDANPSNGATVEVMTFTQTEVNTLPASFVSGLTEVTAVGADHFMIFDATDSALKKSLVSDVLESATSISTSADATAITIDSSENVTFTNNVTINSGQLTAGGLAYPTSDGTNGQVLTTDGSGTLSFSTVSGTTINNNADNRIITGSGTANTLEGEANLTFDGTNVVIGSSSALGLLTIKAPSSDDQDLITISEDGTNQAFSINSNFAGSGSTNNNITLDSYWTNDIISFRGDGSVGIATASPLTQNNGVTLTLGDGSTQHQPYLKFNRNSTGGYWAGIKWNHGGTESAAIEENADKDLMFATNGAERLRILSSGGLTFNGDTATANALDDYEEGTWRPTVAGATTAGSYVYGENAGVYTKIGNQVTCSFYILQLGANTDGSGALIINNLPFTVASITAGTVLDYFTGTVTLENFDVHTNTRSLASHAIAGTTHITFFETKDAALDGTVVTTDRVDGNADIIGQITYRTT
jgi:hypothetical protein